MAKKQEDPPKGAPAWMATFSDLMNLLLCFFVLLFSMSSVDAAKYDLVVNSLKSAFSVLNAGGSSVLEGTLIGSGVSQMPDYSNYFGDTLYDSEGNEAEDGEDRDLIEGGGVTSESNREALSDNTDSSESENAGAPMSTSQAQELLEKKALEESENMAENIGQLAKEYGLQDSVEIDYNGDYVRLTLNGALLFDSGKAEIKSGAYGVVDNIGKILNSYGDCLVEVEGHSDNVPIKSGKYENNDVLSMYRALSLADRLREVSTINPGNIKSSGRGDYAPIADNSTPEGRSRNRRVEIIIHNSYTSKALQSEQ